MESVGQELEGARGGDERDAGGTESVPRLEQGVGRLQEELVSERERTLRAVADFDNYRRRVRRERAASEHSGKKDILLALLEVADDFDRVHEAMSTVEDGGRESGTVYAEDRRGYLWNDELLRPARVVVVR